MLIPYIIDAFVCPSAERYRTPNAKCYQTGSPVPAIFKAGCTMERTDCFIKDTTYPRLVWTSIVTIGQRVEFLNTRLNGIMEINLEFIISCLQYSLDITHPSAMHVVGDQYSRTVEIDITIGIDSLENYLLIRSAEFFCCRREMVFITPIVLINPLDCLFIETEERVIDDFCTHQIGMNRSRNGGIMPTFISALMEPPSFMKCAFPANCVPCQTHGKHG